ncbi:MAG: hypothetical protein IM445_09955 [Microcystis sp. M015S1]|jgi:hypothetical protein|nr:hypothetical protein [Microcystis sp. M015S1]
MHGKSDEAKRHDSYALKEQQQASDAPRKKHAAPCTEKPKEQTREERKTNKPAATWKVFAMVRLLT